MSEKRSIRIEALGGTLLAGAVLLGGCADFAMEVEVHDPFTNDADPRTGGGWSRWINRILTTVRMPGSPRVCGHCELSGRSGRLAAIAQVSYAF